MSNSKFIASVEHIISIRLSDYSISRYNEFHPSCTIMEREKFWKRKRPVKYPSGWGTYGPHSYHYNKDEYFSSIHDYLKSLDDERFMVKELDVEVLEDSGKERIVWRPYVKFTLVGGKYTGEKYVYFDEYSEAEKYVNELLKEYPGKFTVITKENK